MVFAALFSKDTLNWLKDCEKDFYMTPFHLMNVLFINECWKESISRYEFLANVLQESSANYLLSSWHERENW